MRVHLSLSWNVSRIQQSNGKRIILTNGRPDRNNIGVCNRFNRNVIQLDQYLIILISLPKCKLMCLMSIQRQERGQ